MGKAPGWSVSRSRVFVKVYFAISITVGCILPFGRPSAIFKARPRWSPPTVRKLYPRPCQCVMDHPLASSLPPSAYGMLIRLLDQFWRQDCIPLPTDEARLFVLSQAHRATWSAWKVPILTILRDVTPELAGYRETRIKRTDGLRIASRNGSAKRSAMATVERIAQSNPPPANPDNFHQMGITPHRGQPVIRPPTPDKRPPRPIRVDTLTKR